MNFLELLAHALEQPQPKIVHRTWFERLFSWPWKPWVSRRVVWEPPARFGDADPPQSVSQVPHAAAPTRPTINPCLHCAVLGSVELWQRTHAQDTPSLEIRFHVLKSIDHVMNDLEAAWAGKPFTGEH